MVYDAPLAFCDPQSVEERDLLAVSRPSQDYVGEVYYLKFNPNQRFYYINGQTPEEMALFLTYDSSARSGTACKSPVAWIFLVVKAVFLVVQHASFDNPAAPPDATPRESIEARAIIITKLESKA